MKLKQVHQDVYISVVLYIVLAFFINPLLKLPNDSATFPILILAAFGILNTVVLINGIKKTKLMRNGDASIVNTINFEMLKVPLIIYSIMIGYAILFRFTNYFIATSIMLLTVMLFYKIRSWKLLIPVIVVYNIFIYLLFVMQLNVPLL